MNDLVFSIIVVLIALVVLGIPEIFWKVFTVFFIFAAGVGVIYLLRELTLAAPLVSLGFLAGAVFAATVLLFSRRLA